MYHFFVFPRALKRATQETQQTVAATEPEYIETRESGYEFIEPLLECDIDYMAPRYEVLREELSSLLASRGIEEHTNLYFRDLRTGMWIGSNEDQPIAPASMTKVLTVMAAYKKAEENPEFLKEKAVYANEFSQVRNLGEQQADRQLVAGMEYSVEELVERSLLYSDNEAALVLRSLLGKQFPTYVETLESDLHMRLDGTITLRDYSHLFRLLYNASFLNREHSEIILKLLSQSDFSQGITTGVPKGVVVAHKFGFYDPPQGVDDRYRFNHCGIVYAPSNPYLLCMSVSAETLDLLNSRGLVMGEVSEHIYTWIQEQRKKVRR